MKNDYKTDLELLIDRVGLAAVVQTLAEICFEKADHIRTDWQDGATARPWDKDGKKLSSLSDRLES